MKLPRELVAIIACVLAATTLSGCGRVAEGKRPTGLSDRRIRAVATTGMVADAVAHVGGRRVDVEGLMGPGIDPHLYKASERDVIDLAASDIVFYNGLHLEAKMADVFEQMQDFKTTVAVTDYIDRSRLLSPPEFDGNYDPHVWFDVTMWMSATRRVRDALVDIDPSSANYYRSNARSFLETLRELHRYVLRRANEIEPSLRVVITAHDAFNYFGRAYGFEVRGLQGISTTAEAGTADVSGLADFIAERRIPAIFVESSVPPRFIDAVRAAVRARGFEVEVGGVLYSDAMGDPGTPDDTYVGMVRHNIDTIASALMDGSGAGDGGG